MVLQTLKCQEARIFLAIWFLRHEYIIVDPLSKPDEMQTLPYFHSKQTLSVAWNDPTQVVAAMVNRYKLGGDGYTRLWEGSEIHNSSASLIMLSATFMKILRWKFKFLVNNVIWKIFLYASINQSKVSERRLFQFQFGQSMFGQFQLLIFE